MKYAIVVILALMSCFAYAQDISGHACTPAEINCDVQRNKSFEVVKSRLTGKQSFIIKDSCYCFNRVVDTMGLDRVIYYPAYILSKEEVAKVETSLLEQLGASTGKLRTLYRKYYRQYKAYRTADNTIRIKVLFSTRKFLRKNESFRFQSVQPLVINSSRHPFFSCEVSMVPGATVQLITINEL